ncbi:pyrroline-5-carboxylate reductase [Lentisalinibacter salinarum]|uniref:pyrroline-5-carboxylate reductase n=1 Tax=Lentisalinibacter salinarum TaxID=2992239 RepID=UPI003866ADA8
MSEPVIGFIGGGNMATAIMRGLLAKGVDAERIAVADPSEERRDALAALLPGGRVSADNRDVAAAADVLVLAVKPQVMADVLPPLAETVQASAPLVVSIAAGIRSDDIDAWLGGGLAVVRCMPNQPALVGQGMTVLYANRRALPGRDRADDVLSAAGPTLWVDEESMIDAATAISGSGPAYFFYLLEAIIATAVEFGFTPEQARRLAVQTAKGAAATAESEADEPAVLRERVTSPGGTTAAAFAVLEDVDVRAIFRRAIHAARRRAAELAGDAAAD